MPRVSSQVQSTKPLATRNVAPSSQRNDGMKKRTPTREESIEDYSNAVSSEESFVHEKENAAPNVKLAKVTSRSNTKESAKRKRTDSEEEDEEDEKPKRGQRKAPSAPKRKHRQVEEKEEDDEGEHSGKKEDGKTRNAKTNKDARKKPKHEEQPAAEAPKTPLVTEAKRAKELCMSVKRHLAQPLTTDESVFALDKTQVPQTPRVSKMRGGTEVVAKSDYDELLDRFNELKALRTTKAEKMYAKLQATTEAREKATNKYIETLKDENKRLKEERDALKAGKKAEEEKAKEESKKEAAQANQELQRVKTQLSLYRLLTQLDARPYPEEGADAFLCSCQNPSDKRALKFVLTMTEDSVEYKPIEIGKQPRWEINEMFVKEIYFSPQLTPIFLSKLLATVYGSKKEK